MNYQEFLSRSHFSKDELLAHAKLLAEFGPTLGRPRADTLNGSHYANMKARLDRSEKLIEQPFCFLPACHFNRLLPRCDVRPLT